MVITLIGYRGTGKSTVGSQLAARLNFSCVDTDQEVVRLTRKTIAEIFADDGEPYFRELEASELDRRLHQDNIVISAGGGAILDQISRERMREAGHVVWLQATVETICERLANDENSAANRPALTSASMLSEVESVLRQREPLYADAATTTVSVDGRSVAAIVDEIIAQLPAAEPLG